jgi:VIT1/CCC1 family predicted Fe2+/Mn2+ transporter
LDDRLLEDIGMARAHISDFVRDLDKAVVSGRIEGLTAAQKVRSATALSQPTTPSNLSRRAAGDLSKLDPKALADHGYVKGEAEPKSVAA